MERLLLPHCWLSTFLFESEKLKQKFKPLKAVVVFFVKRGAMVVFNACSIRGFSFLAVRWNTELVEQVLTLIGY